MVFNIFDVHPRSLGKWFPIWLERICFKWAAKKKTPTKEQVLILIVIIILDGGFVSYEVDFFLFEFLELNGLVLFWVMKILGHLFRDHSIGPFWGDQTMQMYGKLEGFPLFWALFGLVIEWPLFACMEKVPLVVWRVFFVGDYWNYSVMWGLFRKP